MAKRILKILIIILLIAAICAGCYFIVDAVSDSGSSSSTGADSSTSTSADASTSSSTSTSSGSSSDSDSGGTEPAETAMLALGGRYIWKSADDVVSISYEDEQTYAVTATVNGNEATQITATINEDIYDEFKENVVDVASSLAIPELDIKIEYDCTSTFNINEAIETLASITILNYLVFENYAEEYYDSGIPLITITATDGNCTAEFGLLVMADGYGESYLLSIVES